MATYPTPGRGAWTLTGGLLPARAGSTSRAGYYRLAATGEKAIGSTWADGSDTSHHAQVVNLGVKALQTRVNVVPDGWYGPGTDRAVRAAQQALSLEVDGIVGRATMRALLRPLVLTEGGTAGVPEAVLGGILAHESALDPAAVGVNGLDHGLAQINLGAHEDEVSLEAAMDPEFCIRWTAVELARIYKTWKGKTVVDPWTIAIANHNSPLLAKKWAVMGAPPYVAGRVFQIEEYVNDVRSAW